MMYVVSGVGAGVGKGDGVGAGAVAVWVGLGLGVGPAGVVDELHDAINPASAMTAT
jgi:hypothetical protein